MNMEKDLIPSFCH